MELGLLWHRKVINRRSKVAENLSFLSFGGKLVEKSFANVKRFKAPLTSARVCLN
jgi:hypothetical protein